MREDGGDEVTENRGLDIEEDLGASGRDERSAMREEQQSARVRNIYNRKNIIY